MNSTPLIDSQVHTAVLLSTHRMLSSRQLAQTPLSQLKLCICSITILTSPFQAPGNPLSPLLLYEFDYCRRLGYVEPWSICPSVAGRRYFTNNLEVHACRHKRRDFLLPFLEDLPAC